ncbi:MAG: glycoside hydrolase family 3 C-terminal domain-containing protein [Prevotella sp.]|nr:glycoside hydrolase family 3 C-terminal domain-containing protein [Prevotella sp.]
MKNLKTVLLSAACMVALGVAAQPKLSKATIKDVVKAMTLDEKIEFLHGIGMPAASGSGPVTGSVQGKVPGSAGETQRMERLGIPAIIMADGPAGLRIDTIRGDKTRRYYTTAFPTGTILASTWNTALVEEVGNAMGNETKEYGVDILLAPGMNIQRNLLCGRNYEYYSEDPYLTGHIAAAMVNGVQKNGVGTSVKHFAANNQETRRASVDARMSERVLREIYLRAFQYVVKTAQPWTVMSSYNKLNGSFTAESKYLLTTILRDEWGFKGMVTTDWFAGKDFAAQVAAGNDLMMPGRPNETEQIKAAIANGTLSMEEVDRNIERILELVVKCPSFLGYKYTDNPDLKAHAQVSRNAATEGMVLLKNGLTPVLPLKKGMSVALLGNYSYKTIVGGTGSGEVPSAHNVSIAEGFQSAGFTINKELVALHAKYIAEEEAKLPPRTQIIQKVEAIPERLWTKDELEQLAAKNDIAVITIGRIAGEGRDRKVDADYKLSEAELAMLSNASEVFHAKGKKVVAVLNVDGVIDAYTWADKVDAILVAWLPGVQAGNAVADVVCGKVNPSGKLAITFPKAYEDVPSAKDFPGVPAKKPQYCEYNDDIFVGYRYHNTKNVEPAYPFGYGLSYTTFSMSGLKLNAKTFNNKLTATVIVKNTGKVAGKEVVQLYLSAPVASQEKPSEELKGFVKTKLLKPGEKQVITFTLSADDLASYYPDQSSWIADKGTYTVKVGNSSRNFQQETSFTLENDVVTEKCHSMEK